VIPSLRVRKTWERRVIAEYRSAAISAELLHWLIQIGVSPDTIERCHEIVQEELNHAEMSRAVYLAAGGSLDRIQIPYQQLAYPKEKESPVPLRALSMCTRVFCCGETVAVPLFNALLKHSENKLTDPVLEQIVADEAGHKYFGWTLLDELLELLGEPVKEWLKQRIAGYIEEVRTNYHSDNDCCVPEDQAWGLMTGTEYSTITERCITEVIEPRFKARGLL
jgi:hypothetical protein